jgi:hypothetical protein
MRAEWQANRILSSIDFGGSVPVSVPNLDSDQEAGWSTSQPVSTSVRSPSSDLMLQQGFVFRFTFGNLANHQPFADG